MKYFSIPADFKIETIDKIHNLNLNYRDSKVIETYGQITIGEFVYSGRVSDVLPEVDYNKLKEYIIYSKEKGIDFNYTLNPACLGNFEFSKKGIYELSEFLKRLANIGVRNLTLTSPSLMELVAASNLDFNIKASAICEITSPSKALFYKNLGCQRVVVDPDITKEFGKLRNISEALGEGVEIIINNVCLKNCAYKMFHYNHEAHCNLHNPDQGIKDYFFNRCSIQKASSFINPIKLNWIRPEDLNYYEKSGIQYFKIQGRQNIIKGDIVRTLQCYFKESFDGNLFDLITIFAPYNSFQPYIDNKMLNGYIKGMFENTNLCNDSCYKCNYCLTYAQKSMRRELVEEKNEQAIKFYRDFDEYSKNIYENQKKIKTEKVDLDKSNLKFDFED